MGDIAVIYIEKTNPNKKTVRIEANFEEISNLECISDPIAKGYSYLELSEDRKLLVFEKGDLAADTNLGHYSLDPF